MSDHREPQVRPEPLLDVFCGALNPAVGRVYARWGESELAGAELRGTLTGPSCEYASTLPATSRFVDRGPGGPPLAEAIVPEPSFWTPELPHVYQAALELQHEGRLVAKESRMFGFRPLGAVGTRLRLNGKNWVLRGVAVQQGAAGDLSAWRESGSVLVVKSPEDALCAAASRLGVLLVAELDEADRSEIRRLSGWPAVGLVSLPAGAVVDLKGLPHNLLFAERLRSGQEAEPSSWADIVFSETAGAHDWRPPGANVPLIARRPAAVASVQAGRAACDRLQAELAPHGLLAGYIC